MDKEQTQAWIESEVSALVDRMQGFGMRLRGKVGLSLSRENYDIVLVADFADGMAVGAEGSINGPVLRSISDENRTAILQDKLSRIMHALMFKEA